MITAHQRRARLRFVLVVSSLLVVAEITTPARQAPDGSQGWNIPDGAAMERNPEPVSAAVLARGQNLYKAKCQRCHGVDGAGHGPEAEPDHLPGDLTDARRASRNPDGVMFYKIWNGPYETEDAGHENGRDEGRRVGAHSVREYSAQVGAQWSPRML